MDVEECKISVWVCREEKLVSGLSRRTTCADVVKVLLEDQNLHQGTTMLSGSAQSYCIVEKWRGFERILPNKTKILRLWNAWGEEQENIRFVLVKNEASLPNTGPRSAEARVVLSRESPRVYKGTARATMTLVDSKPELDSVIQSDQPCPAETFSKFEEYARRCEEVLMLQEKLAEQESLMDSITAEIQEELNQSWMKRRQKELAGRDPESGWQEAAAPVLTAGASAETDISPDNESLLEEERIKTQLDTSLYIGLRLNTDLEAIRGDLNLSQELWDAKDKELRSLFEKVNALDTEEAAKESEEEKENTSVVTENVMSPSLERDCEWVEQARGLSKTCGTNDEDSDTGLSSMHSQDSDNAAVCESLV
nr:ras association domain-containing protein 10 isoform X2 [Paramormyrops kingsleyae]